MAYDHRIPIGSAKLMVHGDVRFFSAHAIGDLNTSLLLESGYPITAYVRNIADSRFIPDGWGVTNAGVEEQVGDPTVDSDAGLVPEPED